MIVYYLDRNIHEYMRRPESEDGKLLLEKVIELKKNGAIFPHSDIHAEEIGTAFATNTVTDINSQYMEEEMKFVASVSDGRIILPARDEPSFRIINEDINNRLDIVKNGISETIDAIENDVNKKLAKVKEDFCIKHKITTGDFGGKSADGLWDIPGVEKLYEEYSLEYPLLANSPVQAFNRMAEIEHLYDFMDVIGFAQTKKISQRDKLRARMYDTGHIIRASTVCTYFVTADIRLSEKAIAIYKKICSETIVLTKEDFLNHP